MPPACQCYARSSHLWINLLSLPLQVNSRKALAAVMERYGVPPSAFARVCVVVDKIEKLPREKVRCTLNALCCVSALRCAAF